MIKEENNNDGGTGVNMSKNRITIVLLRRTNAEIVSVSFSGVQRLKV